MAKKKDNTTIKEKTVAQDKKRATRKKKDMTATVENIKQEQSEKVKASPIKKTINTERPKTFKEIVSVVDFEDNVSESAVVEDPVSTSTAGEVTASVSTSVETKKEQETINQESTVQDVPTHIGGVKLSDRLINLLRRQANNK